MYLKGTLGRRCCLFTAKQRLSSPILRDYFIKTTLIKCNMCVFFSSKGKSHLGYSFPLNKELEIYREISPKIDLRKLKAQQPLSGYVMQMQVKGAGKQEKALP